VVAVDAAGAIGAVEGKTRRAAAAQGMDLRPAPRVTAAEWDAFVRGVKVGEFD